MLLDQVLKKVEGTTNHFTMEDEYIIPQPVAVPQVVNLMPQGWAQYQLKMPRIMLMVSMAWIVRKKSYMGRIQAT